MFEQEVVQREKTLDRLLGCLEGPSGGGPAPAPKDRKKELQDEMKGYLEEASKNEGTFKDYYMEEATRCLNELKEL